jgi:hypothetical protein
MILISEFTVTRLHVARCLVCLGVAG